MYDKLNQDTVGPMKIIILLDHLVEWKYTYIRI